MSQPRVRPTFERPLLANPASVFTALDQALRDVNGQCTGQTHGQHALLRIRSEARHIWSPALQVHVERDDNGEPVLHGRFSPSSPVWTAFVAIYLALLCVLIAAGCYGYAQWTVNETPWALIGVPVALLLAGLTYGAAFIGQGLGAEDMYKLRTFVERIANSAGAGNAAARATAD